MPCSAKEKRSFPLFHGPYDDEGEKGLTSNKINPSTAESGKTCGSPPARIPAVALCPGL
jgi:hypothetical protein